MARTLEQLQALKNQGVNFGPKMQANYDRLLAAQGGSGAPLPRPGSPMDKGINRGETLLGEGMNLGQLLAPELFEGGSGLDRITPERLDANALASILDPSRTRGLSQLAQTREGFGTLVDTAQGRLGGLDAMENQALKENLFRDIDRGRAGAMNDVSRAQARGMGAGQSFAQRRALERDFGNQGIQANRQLALDNIGIKRQALGDFQNALTGRAGAVGADIDRLGAIDSAELGLRTGVGQFNTQNQMAADQFNAGQQSAEIAGRIGATAAGTGLIQDERDKIVQNKKLKQLMDFLNQQDATNFSQLQAILG